MMSLQICLESVGQTLFNFLDTYNRVNMHFKNFLFSTFEFDSFCNKIIDLRDAFASKQVKTADIALS